MAIQTINNGETGLSVRNKLNANFSTLGADRDLSKYVFSLAANAAESSIVVTDRDGTSISVDIPEITDFRLANELMIEDNTIWIIYDFEVAGSGAGTRNARIARLEDVSVDISANTMYYTFAESAELTDGVNTLRNVHGTCFNTEFIYASTRQNPTVIGKINKYDFFDIQTQVMPADGNYRGGDLLIIYNDELFLQTTDFTYSDKVRVAKINALDITDFELIINDTAGASSSPQYIGIYQGDLILCRGAFGKTFQIERYSTNGELLDSSGNLTVTTPYNGIYHAGAIRSNKLYIASIFSRSLARIDLDTLTIDIQIETPNGCTDDIAFGQDGYLYIGSEFADFGPPNVSDSFLYKFDPTDLTFTSIYEFPETCYGSFTIKTFKANYNGVMSTKDYETLTTLTNGIGTTANGTAVDLGGTIAGGESATIFMSDSGAGSSIEIGNSGAGGLFQLTADDTIPAARLIVQYDSGSEGLRIGGGSSVPVSIQASGGNFSPDFQLSMLEEEGANRVSHFVLEDSNVTGVNEHYFRITDFRSTTRGLEYAADYSADFTTRSLVDKAYVDANGFSGSYTVDDASTNTSIEIASFNRTTSGTASNNIGGYITIGVENASGDVQPLHIIHSLTDAGGATEDSRFRIDGQVNSLLTNLVIIDGDGTMALGPQATSAGGTSIAIGQLAIASGTASIALGVGAEAEATNVIAIGTDAGNTTGTKGTSSISIGDNANSASANIGQSSIAIGTGATSDDSNTVALSTNSSAGNSAAIAIGASSSAQGVSSIALGQTTIASTNNTIAIGNGAEAEAIDAIAIGTNAGDTTGTKAAGSISIGENANAGLNNIGENSIAIGSDAEAHTIESISIGRLAGVNSGTDNGEHISIGKQSNQNADGIGNESVAVGIGTSVTSTAQWGVALGSAATVSGARGIAISLSSEASATGATAIGSLTKATAQGAIMMGYNALALTNDRTDSFALGWDEQIPTMWIEKYTATTTGVAGTDTVDIPLDESSTYSIEIQIVGGESDATPTMYYATTRQLGAYRISTGNVVLMGDQLNTEHTSTAAGTENVTSTVTASTTNIRITFTGPDTTSTNMNWRALVKMTKVESA